MSGDGSKVIVVEYRITCLTTTYDKGKGGPRTK